MGCCALAVTTFLKTRPYSWRSKLMQIALEFLRAGSGNGACSIGEYVHVLARKERESDLYLPEWLFPKTEDPGSSTHLQHSEKVTG